MFYQAVKYIVSLFLLIFNRWEIKRNTSIPAEGPLVIISNHVSLWDPLFLACSVNRKVHYMAKEELFRIPVLKQIITALLAFPVKRGRVDRNAMRLAVKCLEDGEVLGLFPEGTRSKTGELLPFQAGAALFALKAGAPLVPVALIGTRTTFPGTWRGHIKVKIGQPLVYQEFYGNKVTAADLEKVNNDLRNSIKKLLEEQDKM